MIGLILFDTALGAVGLAWGERGIVAVRLPTATPEGTRASLLARHPDACEASPPPAIRAVIDGIVALTSGERVDLSAAPLDRCGLPDFQARVTDVTLAISPGETLTYGEVARRIGEPGAAQAVGKALGANPWPIVVPCHRVLAASGKTGGFSAPGGVDTKLKLLSIERARTSAAPTLFDGDPAFGFVARPRGS
ncbi:MAG: methylated-DNA--[protein]-cysteine S-methyltransferase [Phreatobacter sp.]|uniref:methylated-DNA--[protein]-cysteine S-methyltransferase n=1 Tax=Phreatobacter sp. TaxID=1966341 RepID=UPI00273284A8|nr:methylated-DNA--[protein]-cysteine S-methyltransferase [Phreatobacter sp.]MDP2803110.1 methylated-DNA--[protein]-cysteine S-methyltransferase [Phreatobacter sp.]